MAAIARGSTTFQVSRYLKANYREKGGACHRQLCWSLSQMWRGFWSYEGMRRLTWVNKLKTIPRRHFRQSDSKMYKDIYKGLKWSEVAQLCLILCDPINCSLPSFSIHGIFQARVLKWVGISFSRGSSWPRDRTQVSRIVGRRFYHLNHSQNSTVKRKKNPIREWTKKH